MMLVMKDSMLMRIMLDENRQMRVKMMMVLSSLFHRESIHPLEKHQDDDDDQKINCSYP